MSKAKRLRELEAENNSLKYQNKLLMREIKEMRDKSKRTIGTSSTYKENELHGDAK